MKEIVYTTYGNEKSKGGKFAYHTHFELCIEQPFVSYYLM